MQLSLYREVLMSDPACPQSRFDVRTGQLVRQCLRGCGYQADLIVDDYPTDNGLTVSLVAFAHRPQDARSSCIAFLPEPLNPYLDLLRLKDLGVPLAFTRNAKSWKMWSLRIDGPRLDRDLSDSKLERFFAERKDELAPGSVFRAKTWARTGESRQLDFVDIGLLPLVEQEAGARLRQLFEEMVAHTTDAAGFDDMKLTDRDAHWLMKANFWLLAGKLLRDKEVPKFIRLDLQDVQGVFDRVAEHYDAKRVNANGRLTALRGAARKAAEFSSFRSVSMETLGALYEEALLSERTRKLLSVHRTPTYLVDYMLAKMSSWVEREIGIQNCRIYEPACGHAPFLVGAVRLLSELLPANIASDRVARRQFLRSHLGGCDRDPFALEIARLSLTLADIPNPNGWHLDPVNDMFDGDYLAQQIGKHSIVLANPPFEKAEISAQARAAGDLRYARSGQAGELLRRIINNAAPNSFFGIVVPQTLLDGASFRTLRQDLLSKMELREVVTFPDNVFRFANPETAILLGRKLPEGTTATCSFNFRRVRKPDMDSFRRTNRLPEGAQLLPAEVLAKPNHQLLLPPLGEVWRATEALPQLEQKAHSTIGFYFYSEKDRSFPKGEVQVSEKHAQGFHQGFRLSEGTPDTHLLPKLDWLNQSEGIIRRACGGTKRGIPRIVMNHVRTGGGAWRHKAFIDEVGRPATDAFLLLSPKDSYWSLQLLWALANGPFANAFTFTNSAVKQIGVRLLQRMPVPLITSEPHNLNAAVDCYLQAAREFSTQQPPKEKKHQSHDGLDLFNQKPEPQPIDLTAEKSDHLRALHWRIDAEVLKLYALPAETERALLDFFDGVPRVGVPFKQICYIPAAFRETQRLDEFLRITDEWDLTDKRRCQLIEKRIRNGKRTPDEEAEFNDLQKLFDLRRSFLRWQRTGDANSPLIDETKLQRLSTSAPHPK